jgi:hypothetical protein
MAMISDYDPVTAPATPAGTRSIRTILIVVALAFLSGLAAMAWLFASWDRARALLPADARPLAAAQGLPAGDPAAPAGAPGTLPIDPAVAGSLDARVAELEARIARVSERAQAASGNAARAEGLLVAFAARRALDRGMALGYIEAQLRERFGATQTRAVATVIAASRDPVTVEELQIGLDDLGPVLSRGEGDSWWGSLQREVSELIVVRKAGSPSPAPAERLRRARRMLEGGRVDAALAEVSRMPGRERAQNWINAARRYIQSRRALDVIETAAILEPRDAAPVAVPVPGPEAF